MTTQREQLRRRGLHLVWATIAWNVTESVITIALGLAAGSIALTAFGLDSMVEVFASLVVVWHARDLDDMDVHHRSRRALRLLGGAFGVLGVFLTATSIQRLVSGARPEESPFGIAYLALTALVMFGLAWAKRRVAVKLDNDPLAAEARLSFLDGLLASGITIVTVSSPVRSPSSAVNCSSYVPAAENVAVVSSAEASANVTVPGPDTFDHVVVYGPGSPSSLTDPFRTASFGMVTVAGPAAVACGA